MTLFDYLLLFALGASSVIGLMRGLVKEVLSLLGWVLAFVLANAYGASLGAMLPPAIPGEAVRLMVAFVVLFIGVRLLAGVLAMALGALLQGGGLGLLDRLLGAVFGLARGLLIVLAAVIVCGMTSIPQQPFWKDALLSPLAQTAVRTIKPLLPQALARHVHF